MGWAVNDAKMALLIAGGAAAVGLAYLATRTAGPVKLAQFTELREGPLQEHLVTKEELGLIPAPSKMSYPGQVAQHMSMCVQYGFAPLYQIPDAVAAALPAEAAW